MMCNRLRISDKFLDLTAKFPNWLNWQYVNDLASRQLSRLLIGKIFTCITFIVNTEVKLWNSLKQASFSFNLISWPRTREHRYFEEEESRFSDYWKQNISISNSYPSCSQYTSKEVTGTWQVAIRKWRIRRRHGCKPISRITKIRSDHG